MVTFWSMRTLTFVKTMELPFARGVTLTRDGQRFVVSYGLSADVIQIAPDSLALDRNSNLSQSYLSGSHVFNSTRLTGLDRPS